MANNVKTYIFARSARNAAEKMLRKERGNVKCASLQNDYNSIELDNGERYLFMTLSVFDRWKIGKRFVEV